MWGLGFRIRGVGLRDCRVQGFQGLGGFREYRVFRGQRVGLS